MGTHRYKLTVLGRYPARLRNNESHVTVNFLAGSEDRLVHSGTLTMSEPEWEDLVAALHEGLGDRIEIDDRRR
ncbi:MAG TPA: hypothetical protein VG929_06440 [Actinomycetota bacterium]|nr:hypothetical protein [Actinomycetota bacterium]